MLGPLAYMDPGTGSMFLQLLLGGVAGFVVIVKLYWRRILSFVGLGREEPEPSPRTQLEEDLPGKTEN